MAETTFHSIVPSLGLGSTIYPIVPGELGRVLIKASKRHARFLENRYTGTMHRGMLEVIAKTVAFSDWHSFQTRLARLTEEQSLPASLDDFIPALPLLIRVKPDASPSEECIKALNTFGQKLASTLDVPVHGVMDVLAKLQGSDNFVQLCDRHPAKSPLPLYSFRARVREGSFKPSGACSELILELHKLTTTFFDNNPYEIPSQARAFLKDILHRRPDFLNGWLVQAEIAEHDGDIHLARLSYETGLQRAEALIPANFKGHIHIPNEEGLGPNRVYHRLLYNYMCFIGQQGELKVAINLGRKQLDLDPDYSMDVRFVLSIFLAADHQVKAVEHELRELTEKHELPSPDMYFIISMCQLAVGNLQVGQEMFLRALFYLPMLRELVLKQKLPDFDEIFDPACMYHHDPGPSWQRGIIPDFETLSFHYSLGTTFDPSIEKTFINILQSPEVILAEQQLETTFYDCHHDFYEDEFRSTRVSMDSHKRWEEESIATAGILVTRFGNRWSM